MKQIVLSLLAAGLVLGSGYAEEGTSLPSQAGTLAHEPKASLLKINDKAEAVTQQASEALAKAGDVMANLDLSMDDLKQKVASLDKAQLLAFAEKYKTLFAEYEAMIDSATAKLQELSWFKRLGTEGKALKKQVAGYTAQLGTLKEQYSVYIDQLKALGVDLSAYGL